MRFPFYIVLALVPFVAAPVALQAQIVPKPKPIFTGVGMDQKLNAQVPMDLVFYNEDGETVRLGDYFGTKPVILNMVYYECPMMCGIVLNGVLQSVQAVPLQLDKDYDILTISFDPREKPELAKQKKANYVEKYARDGGAEGWHFLTGPAESSKALADAVGYNYEYDPLTDQYAHAAGIMVLTPQGKVSKYFYGFDYIPRDLRLALVESSQERIGSAVDQILLLCFHYDPMTGKYGLAISFVLQACGIATVVVLGAFVFHSLWRDREAKTSPAVADGSSGTPPDDTIQQ